MQYNELVEHGAIALADLQNIDPELSPLEFWAGFRENAKDTYRMESAVVIDAAMKHVIMTSKENGNRIVYRDLNELPPKLRD